MIGLTSPTHLALLLLIALCSSAPSGCRRSDARSAPGCASSRSPSRTRPPPCPRRPRARRPTDATAPVPTRRGGDARRASRRAARADHRRARGSRGGDRRRVRLPQPHPRVARASVAARAPAPGGVRRDRAVLGLGHGEPVRRAPLRVAGDPLAAVVVPGSGARPCGRASDSPPRRLRSRAGGGGARLRLRGPAPACRALAHELRHDALPAPDPGEQLLLVRGHRAARRRLRLRDAARRAHARQPRRALVGRRCAGTGARATSSSRRWRLRCPGPIP